MYFIWGRHTINCTLSYHKGSDWIRLVLAHLFPLNSRAPIASANFNANGKVQVSPYTLMMEPAQLMEAPLLKTNGWAQSSPYPVSPFDSNNILARLLE